MRVPQNWLRNSSATEKDLRIETEESAASKSWGMATGVCYNQAPQWR
jgi:hypothetical protein